MEARFVDMFPASVTRKSLYDGWRARREALTNLVKVEWEWIDGSFVTAKRNPADIDLTTFVDASAVAALSRDDRARLFGLAVAPTAQLVYGCHSFLVVVFPESDFVNYNKYLAARGYWDRQWSFSRSNTPKGYLEIRGDS